MFEFIPYENSGHFSYNEEYFIKLKKFGVNINFSIPKVSEQKIKDFLDKNYESFINLKGYPIDPVASCSHICGSELFVLELEKFFCCKVYTIFGYIETSQKRYFYFDDIDIERALAGEIFNNHHAWFQFENGQLLDLTFVNTFNSVNDKSKIIGNKFQFILSDDSSHVYVPTCLSLTGTDTPSNFFKYIPMFNGQMFNKDYLIAKALQQLSYRFW